MPDVPQIHGIPQLRVRTEFNFKFAYGKVERVAQALKEIGTPTAAIVDHDTWGHVRFRKAMKEAGVRPMYGREVAVPTQDGRVPAAWALAEDIASFYQFSSATTHSGIDIPNLFASSKGIVRFAGAGLTDPECFDYVDINPGSLLQQRRALELARRTGKPLVITSDNNYPRPEDHAAFLAVIDRDSLNPRPIMTEAELRAALIIDAEQFAHALANTFEVANRCTDQLSNAPIIEVPGSLRELVQAGQQYRIRSGHIREWTPEYQIRVERELALIESKKFDSYFIVVSDLIQWAKDRMLVGPARGSSAGSLVCYLLRITEVDPMAFGLLFERFIDVTRNDLPDIDIDFNDVKREAVFGYLATKYGADNVARIGNVSTLKAPSLLKKVAETLAIPEHAWRRLLDVTQFKELPGSPIFGRSIAHAIETTDVGARFGESYPQIKHALPGENHASHTSIHAAGVIVCNVPVTKFCTVDQDGIAHLDKVDAEELNLLKIDALSLSTLTTLEDAGVMTSEQFYSLKPDDPEVFKLIDSGRLVGVFQFEGGSMRKITSKIRRVDGFRLLDHITALSRPGPLDSGATDVYIARENGSEEDAYPHPSLEPILKPTHGIILYQEQVMRICREVAGFPWEDVSDIRRAIGKKKGNDYFDQRRAQFIEGAARTVGMPGDVALSVWQAMITFGTYGFNQSHSVSYGIVSYWCAWMKRYHPLEYAAACLREATEPAKLSEILRECQTQGIDFIAFDPDLSGMTWEVKEGKLVGGFTNIVGIGPAKAAKALQDRANGTLNRERFANPELRFAELFPLRRKYRDWYVNPEAFGCREGTVIATSNEFVPDGWPVYVWLAQVVGKRIRDDNEQRLVDRRKGLVKSGQTRFIDLVCRDDFGTDIIVRVASELWEPLGRMASENLSIGDVVLVRAKKVPQYNILRIVPWGLRCINRPQILEPEFAGAVFDAAGEVTILPPRVGGPEPESVEIVNGDDENASME